MSRPFREMFIELGDALFATIKGLGEQAVREAQKRPDLDFAPSLVGKLITHVDNEAAIQMALARELGWRRVLGMHRKPASAQVEIVADLYCGHRHRLDLDEHRLHLAENPTASMLDQLFERAHERSCYCTPREP